MSRFVAVLLALLMLFSATVCALETENLEDLGLGEEIIIEVGASNVTSSGNWVKNSGLLTPSGASSWYTTQSGTAVKYEADLEPGTYEVYFWRLSHSANNDSNVNVTVSYSEKTDKKAVSFEGTSIDWELIGNYYFTGDGNEYVEFARDETTKNPIVTRSGAVRFVKIGGEEASADEKKAGNVGERLLEVTGVSENVNLKEEAPSRAEFLKMAMAVSGVGAITGSGEPMFADVTAEHPYYGIIAAAIDCNIINGDGNGSFRPEDSITYSEAVKLVVCVLGYDSRAESMGGYPVGYLSVAATIGISNGVKADGFDGKAAVKMLYNALMTKPANTLGIGRKVTVSDLTALELYHNIYYDRGVINGIRGLSLTEEAAPSGMNVRIGRTLFADPEQLASDYIGQKVTYYYRDDTVCELVLVDAAKYNEVLDIPSKEILSATVAGDSVSVQYEYGENGTRTVKSGSSVKVIYNGQILEPPYSDDDFKPKSGKLRFISNSGGDYNYIFVYDYEVYVVNSVNADSKKIYPKYRADVLDLSKENVPDYKIVNGNNGKETAIDNLKAYNVLNVLSKHAGQENNTLTITLTTKKVKGTVEQVTAEGIIIKGKLYEIADSFLPYAKGITVGDAAYLGKEITVYTDISGYIVAADFSETSSENYVYAYQMKAQKKGVTDDVMLSAFTPDGTWEEMKLCDDVIYNGSKMPVKGMLGRESGLINISKFDEMIQKSSEEYTVSVWDTEKVTFSGTWAVSTNVNVLGPDGEGSYYTKLKDATVTYSAAGIPAGTYGLYYWRTVLYDSTTGLDVTVNHADGTYETTIDETPKGNGRSWEYLGNFDFNGVSGDITFQLSPDSTNGSGGASAQRTAAIKFGAPVLDPEEPADYLYQSALPIEQPIYYEKDGQGKIKKIDTLTPGANFTSWLYYSNNKAFVDNGSRLKIEFSADNNTIIFGVPDDLSEKDDYAMMSLGNLTTEKVYSVQPFALDEKLCAKVMVTKSKMDLQTSLPKCVLVSSVGKGINSDEAEAILVQGWQSGSKVSFIGADSDTFKNVKAGDVIIASKNKRGDTSSDASGFQRLFSYENAAAGQNGNLHNDYCTVYGTVKEVNDGGVYTIDIGSENRIYYLSGGSVSIYNAKTKTVKAGNLSDISLEDKIFVRIRRCGAEEIVIYR